MTGLADQEAPGIPGEGVPLVKICGITSEADALLCVGLGADALGFMLAPSPRQVPAALVTDVVRRVPREVLTVGVFRDEAPERVVEIANRTGLRAVQLHGYEPDDAVRYVADRVPCTIRAYTAGDPGIGRFETLGARYILIDGPSPGAGEVFDWRLAEGVVDPGRMFVAGGLTPENVGQAIAHLRPLGVDVSTGVESAPGRKDPNLVRRFIVAARRAAAAGDERAGALRAEDPEVPDASAGGPYDWMGE